MMMLRNSERQTFKTCRHRWQWTWLDGRQAVDAPRALRFGDLIHRALAEYRPKGKKFGPHPAGVFDKLYHEQAKALNDLGFNVYSEDKWVEALDLGKGMLTGYVERYKEEDAEWEVLSTEQTFQLIVPVPPAPGSSLRRFKMVGTFDGVWRHKKQGRVAFKEYKTATSISEDGLALDEQAGAYWTYGPKWLRKQEILKGTQMPSEIIYTFLRKAIPNDDKAKDAEGYVLNKPSKDALVSRYNGQDWWHPKMTVNEMIEKAGPAALLLGERAAVQPKPYFHRLPVYRDATDRARVHARVIEEAREIWEARAGNVFLGKNPGPLHMPNCRGCAVKDACELHETGADFAPVLAMTTTDWHPYAAHELPERY